MKALERMTDAGTRRGAPRVAVTAGAVALALALLGTTGLAHAQAQPAPKETAMVKLIRGLIKSGAIDKATGEALLAQAETEAYAASQAAAKQAWSAPAAGAVAGGAAAAAGEPGDVRIPYISQTTRDQIRDEVKNEVMAQAKSEGWAAPNETPEWTKRIHIEGDFRLRNESRFYSSSNTNQQIDWAQINKSSNGFDVNTNTALNLPPLLNTNQNRTNQFRARARFGIFADVSEQVKAGVRLASSNDDSPVSTNTTLGGGLNKKSVWLDQMWMSYQPFTWMKLTGGRFAPPYVTSDMLFSSDLNIDGIAAQFNKVLPQNPNLELFGSIGFIPLEYSGDNSPSNSLDKMSSQTKWMLGTQFGANWKLDSKNSFRGTVGYFDFRNITGQLSSPCALYAGQTSCDSDWSRPAFMQKGNTLMLLRNIALNPMDPANTPQPQYVGYASKFQLLDLSARWDTVLAGRYPLRFDINYIRNLAYSENDMWTRSGGGIVNNFDGSGNTTRSAFKSGPNAYMFQATFGKPVMAARGDWNVLFGYKRIEPDAVPDAYNDSTFHGGGTNAKGYYLGGSYAFDKNAWITGRWLSTKEVYGAPLSIDTLQIEVNARF
ncbi:putative porin [Pandoraea pnomenusa]|uniref:putative porin n=1 Tax=Pandoraea pnomenusa TaxID=93220 RepID=UPI00334106ED